VIPSINTEIMSTLAIPLEPLGGHLHGTFEHVQLRPDGKHREHIGTRTDLARKLGIRLPGRIPGAQQQPSGRIATNGLNQLAP